MGPGAYPRGGRALPPGEENRLDALEQQVSQILRELRSMRQGQRRDPRPEGTPAPEPRPAPVPRESAN